MANNDKIYFVDEKGTTRAFRAGDSYEQVATNNLEGGKFGHPSQWPGMDICSREG